MLITPRHGAIPRAWRQFVSRSDRTGTVDGPSPARHCASIAREGGIRRELVADTRPRLIETVAMSRSISPHLRPRSSLRPIPVVEMSHRAGNSRWPAASRRNRCSCWAVQACCSTLGIARSFGAWATNATLRETMPRSTASLRAPRMMRWISNTVFGANGLRPSVGCSFWSYSASRWCGLRGRAGR